MPSIHEMRENADRKLDKLEAKATALETQINETKEATLARIESEKQAYKEKLEQLKAQVEESKQLAAEKKQELIAAIDHAKVQLALGKADARDAVEDQRKKISRAIAELEAKIDLELEQADEKIKADMVSAADRLEAQLEAASVSLDSKLDAAAIMLEKENVPLDEKLARTKDEFNAEIKAFKKDIADKRQEASVKWDKFENEFDAGFDKITGAFKKLFR